MGAPLVANVNNALPLVLTAEHGLGGALSAETWPLRAPVFLATTLSLIRHLGCCRRPRPTARFRCCRSGAHRSALG